METTQLGRTGRQFSRLGFGGAPAGLTNYLDRYSPHILAHGAVITCWLTPSSTDRMGLGR